MGLSLYDRWRQMNQATSAPSASDSADLVDVSSTQTLTNKVGYLVDKTNATASGRTIAYGSGALVTGSLVVATGLATVVGFSATLLNQPTGTGTNSNQLLAATSITTGAVTVTSYSVSSVTGATTVSTGSAATGSFSWIAIGT